MKQAQAFLRYEIERRAAPIMGVSISLSELAQVVGITPRHARRLVRRLEEAGVLQTFEGSPNLYVIEGGL